MKACLLFGLMVVMATKNCQATLSATEQSYFTTNGVTVSTSGSDYVFSSTGVPSHATGNFPNADNPNSITTQNYQFYIPQNPTKQSSSTCLPMGPIGMAVNGVALFSPYNIEGKDAVTESSCAETFDSCDGHPDQSGAYHYHQLPGCVASGGNDEVIGIALDGFLIYGTKDSTGNTPTDLDECGGKMVGGVYRYHIQTVYPYIMNCYYGSTSTTQNVIPVCVNFEVCDSAVGLFSSNQILVLSSFGTTLMRILY